MKRAMAHNLHTGALPSQGFLSHAHFRQVWKAPRMTGLDSAVAPVSGTDSLIAAVNLTVSAHRLFA
jgi:hypothetical protein